MGLNYRAPNGDAIDFDAWRVHLLDHDNNNFKSTNITYLGYEIRVSKNYIGNAQKVYSVMVECSEDVTKYANYSIPHQGNSSAENDYQRIITAINNDSDIFEQTQFSPLGDIALFFDPRYNVHVVNVLTAPEAYTYNTREEAQTKFNELVGA